MNELSARLLAAHEAGNVAALVTLYTEAVDLVSHEAAAGFYLTQAYIYALEAGHQSAPVLRQRLVDMGRENGTT